MSSSIQRAVLFGALSLFTVSSFSEPVITRLNAVRIGDRLNVMVALAGKQGGAMQVWQAYDCKTLRAEALYRNFLDNDGATKGRFYGSEFSHYLAPQPGPNQDPEIIKRICSLPERAVVWEKIQTEDKYGSTALIDIANLKRDGDELQVRVGYDYAAKDFDPPYDAPYALKVENYRFNCKTQLHIPVSAQDIDENGYVTDSLDSADIERRKSSFPLTTLLEKNFIQLCSLADPQHFRALGRFTAATHKPLSTTAMPVLPDLSANPSSVMARFPLSASVQQQAKSIIHPWATPRFRQISWVEKNRSGEVKVRMDVDEQGFIRKLEDYGIWKVQRLSLANDTQLEFAMSIASYPTRLKKLDTTLRYPLHAGQQYKSVLINEDPVKRGSESYQSETCNVYEGGNAHEINPAFSGHYLRVDCLIESDKQPALVSRQAWIDDLKVMVPISAKIGDKPEEQTQLLDVKIWR